MSVQLAAPAPTICPSFVEFFFAPSAFFRALNARPGWVKAFWVCAALTMLTTVISLPLVMALARQRALQSNAANVDEIMNTLRASQYVSIVLSPAIVLLRMAVSAYILWVLAVLFGTDFTFRKVLSLVSYVSIAPALDRLLGYSMNYASGISNIQSVEQVRSSFLSVSAFVYLGAHPVLKAIADNCDLFAVWYLALLVIGLATIGRMNKIKASVIVGGLFLIQLLFVVGLTATFMRAAQ